MGKTSDKKRNGVGEQTGDRRQQWGGAGDKVEWGWGWGGSGMLLKGEETVYYKDNISWDVGQVTKATGGDEELKRQHWGDIGYLLG